MKTRAKKVESGTRMADFFKWADAQDPSFKIWAVLAVMAMRTPALQEEALRRHLRWLEECCSPKGVEEISSCGLDNAVAAMIDVVNMRSQTKTRSRLSEALRGNDFGHAMLDFFRGLSDGEKLLLSTFDSYITAHEKQQGQNALREIINDFDPDNIPAEMAPLLGVLAAAEGILSAA